MLTNPHNIEPIVVSPQPREGEFSIADALAEPRVRLNQWLSAVYSRLYLASSGPVLMGETDATSPRFEAARWPRLARGSDVTSAASAYWPALPALRQLAHGFGSPAPELVVVLDANPVGSIPLFNDHGRLLFEVLRLHGYDELSVYMTFAEAKGLPAAEQLDAMAGMFRAYDSRWLAVGRSGQALLKRLGVPAVRTAELKEYMKTGKGSCAKALEDAGLPTGPWFGVPLPAVACEVAPTLMHPLDVPHEYAKKVHEAVARQDSPATPGTPGITFARVLFVSGEAPSVAEAARQAGISPEIAKEVAEAEDWLGKRASHSDQVAGRVMEKLVERESDKIVTARKGVTNLVAKVVGSLNDRFDKGEWIPTVSDFAQLNKGMLALHETASASTDEDIQRLRALTTPKLMQKLYETYKDQWGLPGNEAGPTEAGPA